ncbi:transglycosylase SLT domain-containing protein [Kushneria aurantia]|uniref:Transglycosylase SLT domain-containing protein n=1 Tax=Kushneria aurantia TaxID=504092 RepID=A0ABV6G6J2_9GAMM|nr:transglycosylase SLT domain-containing protein [Kushneria aurantia]
MSLRFQWARRCMGIVLAMATAATVQADDAAVDRALQAARAQQWSQIDQRAVSGHPLEGYIDYHRLKARLPGVSAAEVNAYLTRWQDSVLSQWMRGVAQDAWGVRGEFDRFLAISDGPPDVTRRQCWYYQALLDRDPQRAAVGGRELWRVGHSQPDACDALFTRLRASGEIGAEDIRARLLLAWREGESGLVNYLLGELPMADSPFRSAFEQLRADPTTLARIPARLPANTAGAAPLYSTAMAVLTRQDTARALDTWRRVKGRTPLTEEQQFAIERDLAYYSIVRDIAANAQWADAVAVQLNDQQLFELRARQALEERNWRSVIGWVDHMPPDERAGAHWQYWLGRAYEQLGDQPRARAAWQQAAGERNFYGFAAADRIGQPYALNNRRVAIPPADLEAAAALPLVQRIDALQRIDEPGLARAEWYYAMQRLSDAHKPVLIQYALTRQWYDLAIHGAIGGDYWDVLAWRFPQAYAPLFQQWGAENGVDAWFLMALARRESSFNPEAQSPVGAQGLMQLMPGTGEHVSQQLGIPWRGVASLEQPALNVRLGSAYIRDMAARYSGNRIAAAAAYNAGPGRVDRWLAGSDEPFDLFIEEIPFRETREYVKAVLAYRVIFESLARGSSEGVQMIDASERNARYSNALRR